MAKFLRSVDGWLALWASAASLGAVLLVVVPRDGAAPRATAPSALPTKPAPFPSSPKKSAPDPKGKNPHLYDVFFHESPHFRPGVDSLEFDPVGGQEAGHFGFFPTRYFQHYKGVRVTLGKLNVERSHQSAEVDEVTGEFLPGIDVDVQPRVSAEQALRVAAKKARLPAGRRDQKAELRIERLYGYELERRGQPYALAWRCTLPMGGDRGHHDIIVGADDGKIIAASTSTPPPPSSYAKSTR